MEIRQRKSNKTLQIRENLKRIDIFTKLPQECKVHSKTGILLSFIYTVLIIFIIYIEVLELFSPKVTYKYSIDEQQNDTVTIYFDMTVKMLCKDANFDLMGSDMFPKSSQVINKYPVKYELSKDARGVFDSLKAVTSKFRKNYQSIQKQFSSSEHADATQSLTPFSLKMDPNDPFERVVPEEASDACRLKGQYLVNRVKGNMHLLPGQGMDIPGFNHVHLVDPESMKTSNYSHRIYHFSFGMPLPTQVNPLQAEEFISKENSHTVTYIIQIIPTSFTQFKWFKHDTFQYSVTAYDKTSKQDSQSLIFSFDFYPMRVNINEDYTNPLAWTLRLTSAVGGLFAIFQMFEFIFFTILHKYEDRRTRLEAKRDVTLSLSPEFDA